MRKELFEENEYYHIFNRGVDRRDIFLDDLDRIRFLHSIYVLNNFFMIPEYFNLTTLEPKKLLTAVPPYVEIVAACLMPNHYHLFLTPKRKNGINALFQKVGTSYAMYFNNRRRRTGGLFEGPFKARLVDRHEYATYLTQYIHLNPLDLFPGGGNEEDLLKHVEEYEWSSLPDYLGKKSRTSPIVSTRFRDKILDVDAGEYRKFLRDIFEERTTTR